MNHKYTFLSATFLSACLCLTAFANEQSTALSTARQLSEALGTGNTALVENLLAEDVLIYEGGGVESSLEEYAGHHMPADMSFLSGMTKDLITEKVFEQGDLAVVTSYSRLSGMYNDKAIDIKSTETLVLKQIDNAWKVIHIHWSSR